MATKVLTINAGECFLLPADAVIEAVSTDGAVTFSSDNCPALVNTLQTKTEAFTCYRAVFAGPVTDSGTSNSATQNFEPGNYYVTSIVVNGIEYYISDMAMGNEDDGVYDTPTTIFRFTNFLKSASNPLAPLFSSTVTSSFNSDEGTGTGNDNRGWTVIVNFETIPSIGNNMFFKVKTFLTGQDGSYPEGYAYIKVNPC